MSILEKRVSELTQSEKKKLWCPIGVKGRPFPMRESAEIEGENGNTRHIEFLGQLKVDLLDPDSTEMPLMLYSERTYAEAYGRALREMPIPSMLPLYRKAINLRELGSARTIHYMKGKAGTGKTFMATSIARMRDERGPIVVDCGEKNLAELLYETVLDFGQNSNLYDEFDRRIEQYNQASTQAQKNAAFNPHSIEVLRTHLGEAFDQDENGKIAIDWHKTNQCLKNDKNEYLESYKTVKIVSEGLLTVARKEGFAESAGNALGMTTQEGALIRAWKEGREIVLDEFNRAKEGSHSSLHSVLQFLAGERDEVITENTLKEKGDETMQSFVFRRADQRAGFFVTLTGNDSEDGYDIDELPESLNSRIVPDPIPIETEEDWQHRWCQWLTGVPISTLYEIDRDLWDENPDSFREQLVKWRTLGLPEGTVIPEYQINRLMNWEDTLEATAELARACYGWSQIVDPDSALHRKGSSNLAQLLDEIDESYKKEIAIDFRKIGYFINEALQMGPKVHPVGEGPGFDLTQDYNKPPEMPEKLRQPDPTRHLGDRLIQAMINYLVKTTAKKNKHNLYTQVIKHFADSGLVRPDLKEGKITIRRSTAEKLNNNPYQSPVTSIRAQFVRDLLCDHLRTQDNNIQADNDTLMSVSMVAKALQELEEKEGRTISLFNADSDSVYRSPLIEAAVYDSADALNSNHEQAEPESSDLVSKETLLFALTAPLMREKNLEAFWAQAFTQNNLLVQSEKSGLLNESLSMAEGVSKTGLSVTTLRVSENNQETSLHVLWSKKTDRLVIIGEGEITASLKAAFNYSGTMYVDKNNMDANRQADKALDHLMGTSRKKYEGSLRTAFLMRAQTVGSNVPEQDMDLKDLLVNKTVRPYIPVSIALKPAT